jgi:dolichol-phosphate mannosyltransferase
VTTPAAHPEAVRLSIVIPVFNEADNVLPLLDEVAAAMAGFGPAEVVFVDDGSDDATVDRLRTRLRTAPSEQVGGAGHRLAVRLVRHLRRSGQSAAVRTGVRAAAGTWIATLDGDGQNDPADISGLLAVAEAGGPALVGGVRVRRQDTLSKRLASRFANGLRQALLRDGAVDTGCGLKLFRREAFLELPFFGAMHRFLPALFLMYGHQVAYVTVNHRPRRQGVSKYGNLRRALVGLIDLLGVFWLKCRTPAPTPLAEP